MIFTTATAIDTALTPILTKLDESLDFDRLYGRIIIEAVKGMDGLPKGDKERPRRVPLWYDSVRKTSVPVVPDEKQGGLGFFVTTGPAKPIDSMPNWATFGRVQVKEYPLALLLWWDRTKFEATPDELRQKVEVILGSNTDWLTTSVEDQLATRVFRNLDYDFDNHRYMLYPYCGLRIEGTFTITESVCA